MLELNKVYNMDCLEGMKLIENESIDLIITDPPYNHGKEMINDSLNENDFFEWIANCYKEFNRVLKKDSFVISDFSRKSMFKYVTTANKIIPFYDYFFVYTVNTMAQCGF